MQKIDYLEDKINEILREISELAARVSELETSGNAKKSINLGVSNIKTKSEEDK